MNERWYAIPESLLLKVLEILGRPSYETLELLALLRSLPQVEVSEEHKQQVGFAPPKDTTEENHARWENEGVA